MLLLGYKATFFAVFASFTNLALSARELFTKYLNEAFIIKREVIDQNTNLVLEKANYKSLDELLICLVLITIFIPITTIIIIQKTKYQIKRLKKTPPLKKWRSYYLI